VSLVSSIGSRPVIITKRLGIIEQGFALLKMKSSSKNIKVMPSWNLEEKPQPSRLPRLAKIVILTQATVILSFAIWMYQWYPTNAHFQAYVVNLIASNAIANATMSVATASLFMIGTFTLLG
jgi:hypothetical protein